MNAATAASQMIGSGVRELHLAAALCWNTLGCSLLCSLCSMAGFSLGARNSHRIRKCSFGRSRKWVTQLMRNLHPKRVRAIAVASAHAAKLTECCPGWGQDV